MHYTEIIFFGCFIVFIVGILMLDMLVIDKEAHEVSMKEAGAWTAVWITLALLFSVFLWFHGDLVHGINNFSDLQEVARRYASHLKLDPNDFEGGLEQYRHHMTISYITGYLIEKTLSVDNLFVMMMIFTSFGVSKMEYQRVLNWGILGAIVLRFVFIFSVPRSLPSSTGYCLSSEFSSSIVASRCFSSATRKSRWMSPPILW